MTTADATRILTSYVGFVPGILVTALAALLLSRRLAVPFHISRLHATALIGAIGLVLSATVTPSAEAILRGSVGSTGCDLTRLSLPSLNQLRWPSEVTLNILLFVPLGLIVGLLPGSRARVALVALALASPIAIEGLQLAIGVLGRRCQSGDAVDNLTGLGLGLLAAAGARSLMSVRFGSSPLKESEPPRPGIQPDVAGVAGIVLLVMLALLPRPSTAPSHGWPAVGGATTRAPDGAGRSQRVSSIQGLLEALADDGVREIVVADGTYHVSSSARQAADSLWIGDRFALRTKSVTVRAETIGGVTFDGGGTAYFGGISFEDGAHHQTWDGFVFANGEATQTGVITFGGYAGREAPHHITLRNITIPASVTGNATSLSAPTTDHAIYVSEALDGPHDLLFENLTVDGQGGLASGLVFYHSDASNLNAWNVMIRRLRITGTQHGIILWDQTLHDITIEAATITDVLGSAISYESPGATNILLSDVTSTGSGAGTGFQSSLGPAPPGVTFRNTSLN